MTIYRFFVTAPRGLVPLLGDELTRLGAGAVRREAAGCGVRGPLSFGYRICLWSRTASRVLLMLGESAVDSPDAIHEAVRDIAWEDHLHPEGSLWVDFRGEGAGIRHSQFGAQRVKDGIVDRFRDRTGQRPNVSREAPDLRVHVYLRGKGMTIGIDLGGAPLHHRGYRGAAGPAPLKENLAAGLLLHAGFDRDEHADWSLLDPLSGSGTLPIEAAMMRMDIAPGLHRAGSPEGEGFALQRWLGHDAEAWAELVGEARSRAAEAAERASELPPIVGRDHDPRAATTARDNAERAGVSAAMRFETGPIERARPPSDGSGLLVCNPPYGTRLDDQTAARRTLGALGEVARKHFESWTLAVVVPDDGAMASLGLPATHTRQVDNGPIRARFVTVAVKPVDQERSDHPVANRIRKNLKRLRNWRRNEGVTCYRAYDADIPEYNAAVDVYEDHAVIQEYQAPETVDADAAARRLSELSAAAADALSIPTDRIHVKVRRRQRGRAQYERQAEAGLVLQVAEAGLRFEVNLTDYIDTGLFLDHRITRAWIRAEAKGRRFLNLFSYTGTASVYAAAGGATETVSIDLSNTYLEWTRRNLALNDLDDARHRLIKADVVQWLNAQDPERDRYDLVFLDPPTFSSSKAMQATLDVQRDHAELIERCMNLLSPGGILFFSTNARRFKLDPTIDDRFTVEDHTKPSTPPDFPRTLPHRLFQLRK